MAKHEKPDISQIALWPFVLLSRWLIACILIYLASVAVMQVYGAKHHNVQWIENLIYYYSSFDENSLKIGEKVYRMFFNNFKVFENQTQESIVTLRWNVAKVGDIFKRATFLFGVRLYHVLIVLPSFVLIGIVAGYDGIMQRQIRRACAGHESASIYHRSKSFVFTFLPPCAAAIYLCSPWAYNPLYLLLPTLVVTAILLRLQFAYYKKYL